MQKNGCLCAGVVDKIFTRKRNLKKCQGQKKLFGMVVKNDNIAKSIRE